MKYEPKTLQVQRDGIKQFFSATKSCGAAWWTDSVAADVVDDLAHCEACLAERDAEVERLKDAMPRMAKRRCWECGNVAYHSEQIAPYVCCRKCGSQDTRLVKEPNQ